MTTLVGIQNNLGHCISFRKLLVLFYDIREYGFQPSFDHFCRAISHQSDHERLSFIRRVNRTNCCQILSLNYVRVVILAYVKECYEIM